MKRWIWYTAALVAVLLLGPSGEGDVGGLLPVELIYIRSEDSQILVQADTGDFGRGVDLELAMADLKKTASGEIFLETADYLILTEDTVSLLPQLYGILRPATEVCLGETADTEAAGYLAAHSPGVTLKDLRAGNPRLKVLTKTEERYHLE